MTSLSLDHRQNVDLPDDLLRLILEESFSHPNTSRKQQLDLMLLAKHVYSWLAPAFYCYVVVKGQGGSQEDTLSKFLALPPDLLALTESLCVMHLGDYQALPLQACLNVRQLALQSWIPVALGEPLDAPVPDSLCVNLRRLSISLSCTMDEHWSFEHLRSPLFTSLTHLDLSIHIEYPCTTAAQLLGNMDALRELDKLSHLVISMTGYTGDVHFHETTDLFTVNLPPTLKVLGVWYEYDSYGHPPERFLARVLEECDPRMVLCVNSTEMSTYALDQLRERDMVVEMNHLNWGNSNGWGDPMTNPQENIWIMAERAIRRRAERCGEANHPGKGSP